MLEFVVSASAWELVLAGLMSTAFLITIWVGYRVATDVYE